jgi:hypothetical protein
MLAGVVIEHVREVEGTGGSEFQVPAVALAGSILERAVPVRDALIMELRRRYPGIAVMDKAADPPAGALWRARQR